MINLNQVTNILWENKKVTQITDVNGVILWKAKPAGFILTVDAYCNKGGTVRVWDDDNYGNSGGTLLYEFTVSGIKDFIITTGKYSVKGYGAGRATQESGLITANMTVYCTGDNFICLVKGTPVRLNNNQVKNIEDIKYNDSLLVWDFDHGQLASAKPAWIKIPETAPQYNMIHFNDGSSLKTVGNHRIFDARQGKFIYSATDEAIGAQVPTHDNHIKTIISYEVVHEPVEYYNIITEHHYNLYANDALTSCRFNNLYPIDSTTMKFIKDNRMIQPNTTNIPQYYYDVFRVGELPDASNPNVQGWGPKTWEDYINRLLAHALPRDQEVQ